MKKADDVSPLVQDILAWIAKPEIQAALETHVLRPILQRIFGYMYPYILGVMALWLIMLACLAIVIVVLLRLRIEKGQ